MAIKFSKMMHHKILSEGIFALSNIYTNVSEDDINSSSERNSDSDSVDIKTV